MKQDDLDPWKIAPIVVLVLARTCQPGIPNTGCRRACVLRISALVEECALVTVHVYKVCANWSQRGTNLFTVIHIPQYS